MSRKNWNAAAWILWSDAFERVRAVNGGNSEIAHHDLHRALREGVPRSLFRVLNDHGDDVIYEIPSSFWTSHTIKITLGRGGGISIYPDDIKQIIGKLMPEELNDPGVGLYLDRSATNQLWPSHEAPAAGNTTSLKDSRGRKGSLNWEEVIIAVAAHMYELQDVPSLADLCDYVRQHPRFGDEAADLSESTLKNHLSPLRTEFLNCDNG